MSECVEDVAVAPSWGWMLFLGPIPGTQEFPECSYRHYWGINSPAGNQKLLHQRFQSRLEVWYTQPDLPIHPGMRFALKLWGLGAVAAGALAALWRWVEMGSARATNCLNPVLGSSILYFFLPQTEFSLWFYHLIKVKITAYKRSVVVSADTATFFASVDFK